ncbi:MAG: hypoxanthine phosphoribosyltransferase [Desulfovibrio sp.]|jgi:hypoxanthine phosphoribosyltransferase|nr:hypoxanthine phosphoribosyltransferase [Desulfovibrio sp.]
MTEGDVVFATPVRVGDVMVSGLRVLYGRETIAARVRTLAGEIERLRTDAPLVAVCVLKGGFMFFGDLARYLHTEGLELDFVRLASYGRSSESSGTVSLVKDMETPIADKDVLVVEDVVDTGHTLAFLKAELLRRGPRSVRTAVLVDKPARRVAEFSPDFTGFVLEEDRFIVGYGMDLAERYRTLADICEIVPA